MRPPVAHDSKSLLLPLAAPWTNFCEFLADPRAIEKTTNFRHPPKSAQGVKKSTKRCPRIDFLLILVDFWCPFGGHFLKFLQNAENLDFGDPYGGFEGFYLPKTHNFGTIFSLFFHVFSGAPAGTTFSRFYVDLFTKKYDFGPPGRRSWNPKSTLGATISAQGVEKDEVARMILTPFMTDLAPQGRQRCSPTPLRFHFDRF